MTTPPAYQERYIAAVTAWDGSGRTKTPQPKPGVLADEGIDGRSSLFARDVGHRAKRVLLTLDEAGFGQHIKGNLGLAR